MKVEKKILKNSCVELIIEESVENVAKYRKTVLAEASKHADIKWFRKWSHIPEDVVIRQFWEETILQMTIEKAIEKTYKETLKREKLMPVSQAEIQEVISQSPLKVRIIVEVFPEVEISDDYKKISLSKAHLSVAPWEVELALEEIQTKFTHFHEVDAQYEAKMWDRVTIDTDGHNENAELLEATSMRDYPLVLGSNMLVPGFEEDMVGMKLWETRDLDVNFPKDYHNADFSGKKTKFTVYAKKIEKSHKPEFTPEFIEQLRWEKLDIDGFKKLISSELLETKEMNDGMQREMNLIDELLKYATLEVGEKLLSQQTDSVFAEITENISKDGVKVADYLTSLGLTQEEYKTQHVRATALKRLQWEIILSELKKKENIEISDEDMKWEITQIMSKYQSQDVLKRLEELYIPGAKYYEELKRRVAYKRLIDSFFTKAV